MNWTEQIDAYCERMGPEFWAEPINALTNLAFLLAAAVMWPRVRGILEGRLLCAILAAIGIGSFLFHTFATGWGAALDVGAIAAFVLFYLYLANRHFWGLRPVMAFVGMLLFFPYALLAGSGFEQIGGGSSSLYLAVWLLILAYGLAMTWHDEAVSRGLIIGAAILLFSIVARMADQPLCNIAPSGTHFLWHCLNAIMLGWMIEVFRRKMLSQGAR